MFQEWKWLLLQLSTMLGCWYAPTDCVSWALELYFDHTYFDHISMSDESRSTRALLEGHTGRLGRWATHAPWNHEHHDGHYDHCKGATHAPLNYDHDHLGGHGNDAGHQGHDYGDGEKDSCGNGYVNDRPGDWGFCPEVSKTR